MKIDFTEEEMDIIRKAVNEYEENYYGSERQEWQRIINRLIDRIRK